MAADPIFLTVANGQTVSSAFALERPDRTLLVSVPSYGAGASVTFQFTTTSGTAPFAPLMKDDGSAIYTVFSGSGTGVFGFVKVPPTPWGRIVLGASQSAVTTFTLIPR